VSDAFPGFPPIGPGVLALLPNPRWVATGILTSGQPRPEAFPALRDAGCEAVLNLLPPGQEWTEEEGVAVDLGMDYAVVPVVWLDPRPRDFERFQRVLGDWRGRNLLVHCAANHRVSAFFHILRVVAEGAEPTASAARVRDVWDPNPIWRDYCFRLGAPFPVPGAD